MCLLDEVDDERKGGRMMGMKTRVVADAIEVLYCVRFDNLRPNFSAYQWRRVNSYPMSDQYMWTGLITLNVLTSLSAESETLIAHLLRAPFRRQLHRDLTVACETDVESPSNH